MAINCVNIKSQEFKHLLLISKLPEKVLAVKVALWQKEHGLDSYPTISDLPNIKDDVKNTKVKQESKPKDYTNQIIHLKQSIERVRRSMNKHPKDSETYLKFKAMEASMKDALAKYEVSKNLSYLYELASLELDNIEALITSYEKGNREVSGKDVAELLNKLDSFYQLPELAIRVNDIKSRYTSVMGHLIENTVEEQSNIKQGLSYKELTEDSEDISAFTKYTGALSNLKNKLARTVGALIKTAQSKISKAQGELHDKVKAETNKLEKWAKANNMSLKQAYELFIQDTGTTTVLTKEYTTEFYDKLKKSLKARDKSYQKFAYWDDTVKKFVPLNKRQYENPNYKKIMQTKELKSFYDFYQETIKESLDRLPVARTTEFLKQHPEHFIPNLFTETLSDILKHEKGVVGKLKGLASHITKVKTHDILESDYISNEETERDIIPIKYIAKLTSEQKSKDLGEALFKFAAMSIEHQELTEVLPQARLLQRSIGDNQYINPMRSKKSIPGTESNLYEMVDRFIDMQILGKKTAGKDEFKVANIEDEDGKIIGKKVIKLGELADFGLKWNSLLRIGLNPINAFTNVFVGEIGNITEAFGGRFFNTSDLTKATGIFTTQIVNTGNFGTTKSKLNHLIEKYPVLQELTDYEYASNISVKKGLTGEKLKNFLYSPQRGGEVFLQTRTMVAMMLHTKPDGKTSLWEMLDEKGDIKPEYLKNFGTIEDFNDYMLRQSSKIMGVNEQIHGRYSARDAAILNQNVLARMAFQFKKWIPAAIETRFNSRQFNDRLMVETEGRWRTIGRLIRDYRDTFKRISANEMTELEIYNAKKFATEFTIYLGVIMGALALGWDDDEKKKRDPFYKFTMDQLDKISGDLLFLSNPKNVTAMTKNPIAMTKLLDDLWNTARYIPYAAYLGDYEVKSGPHKGENKFYRSLGKVIPVYNQLGQNIPELLSDTKYIERSK